MAIERKRKRTKQAAHSMNAYKELGKTEARQAFLQLIDEVQDDRTTLAITDRGERVAVILGFKQYEMMLAALEKQHETAKNPLAGLVAKAGDLDHDKIEVNKLFEKSIQQTRKTL